MKRTALVLTALAVCVMMVAPMAMAGKPQPPPAPVEPTGNLVITSTDQFLLIIDGYVRVYDWVSGKFSHTWSGKTGDTFGSSGIIGDVDNDGTKEVLTATILRTQLKGNKYSDTYSLKIWQNGDASGSPSMTIAVSDPMNHMEIGDVDRDGKNELVMIGGTNVQVWDCDISGCTKQATINNLGGGGLTVADSDNDGYDEILVGMASDPYQAKGLIVDYANGGYSVVAYLGIGAIDEMSVGDLDGDGGNEIFGSGYCNGNLYVWRYSNGEYKQVWNGQHKATFDQSNEIADIDGDGSNEIAFTSNAMPPDGVGADEVGLTIYRYSGNNVWAKSARYTPCGASMDMLVSGDPDDDGEAELAASLRIWDWDGTALANVQTITGVYPRDVAM